MKFNRMQNLTHKMEKNSIFVKKGYIIKNATVNLNALGPQTSKRLLLPHR